MTATFASAIINDCRKRRDDQCGQGKDRSGKWIFGHHGDSILRLSGVTGFTACRAVQAEIVAPRRLPDGLLDVSFPDEDVPTPYLVEIVSYADRRADDQALDDILLIALDRRVVPEVISLVLHPRGNAEVQGQQQRASKHGLTRLFAEWHVVNLWKELAEPLLAAGDVGLIPWVPLTHFEGPPGDSAAPLPRTDRPLGEAGRTRQPARGNSTPRQPALHARSAEDLFRRRPTDDRITPAR